MLTSQFSSRARRVGFLVLSAGAIGLFATGASMQGPRFYPDDPIAREPESQDASKTAPYEQSQMYELTYQPVRHIKIQAERAAREEHQHHRRSAGLELVYEPHRSQANLQ